MSLTQLLTLSVARLPLLHAGLITLASLLPAHALAATGLPEPPRMPQGARQRPESPVVPQAAPGGSRRHLAQPGARQLAALALRSRCRHH